MAGAEATSAAAGGPGPLAEPVPSLPLDKSARTIRGMFGRISRRYDLLNHVLSCGLDVLWRRRASRLLAPKAGERVLDLCSGTGDLALELLRRGGPGVRVTAVDFTFEMLALGREKFRRAGTPVPESSADGLRLPFASGTFDCATVSFGVRNFEDAERGLREIHRVLKPGGRFAMLEFTPRPTGPLRSLAEFHLRRVVPLLGGLLSRNPEAYRYLTASVSRWSSPEELAQRLRAIGFVEVSFERLFLGIAAIHLARKAVP